MVVEIIFTNHCLTCIAPKLYHMGLLCWKHFIPWISMSSPNTPNPTPPFRAVSIRIHLIQNSTRRMATESSWRPRVVGSFLFQQICPSLYSLYTKGATRPLFFAPNWKCSALDTKVLVRNALPNLHPKPHPTQTSSSVASLPHFIHARLPKGKQAWEKNKLNT